MLRVELVDGSCLQLEDDLQPGAVMELEPGASLTFVQPRPKAPAHVSLARRLAARVLRRASRQSPQARPTLRPSTRWVVCPPASAEQALTLADVERYLQAREKAQSERDGARLKRLLSFGRLRAA
jgi:hypothetical protein